MTLLRPGTWLDSRRLRAVDRYPVYSPPHPGDSIERSLLEGRDNYTYFLKHKDERLANLRTFLSSFDVFLSFDEAGLRNVDAWMHRYSGHLIGRDRFASFMAFNSFFPAWTGSRAGLNVLWDLGIAAGEFARHLNPSCSWFLGGDSSHGPEKNSFGYLRPCIATQRSPGYWDVFSTIMGIAEAKQKIVLTGKVPGQVFDFVPDALERRVRFRAAL